MIIIAGVLALQVKIKVNIEVFLIILIYCVYLQEGLLVLTDVLCLDLLDPIPGRDHHAILAHCFLTTCSETVRLYYHWVFFVGVFLQVGGLAPFFVFILMLLL